MSLVTQRIALLRAAHPALVLATTIVDLAPDGAVVSATVTSADSWGLSAHGSCTGATDAVEQAEDRALARLLDLLGIAAPDQPADPPPPPAATASDTQLALPTVAPPPPPTPRPSPPAFGYRQPSAGGLLPLTDRQLALAYALTRELKLSPEDVATWCTELVGVPRLEDLNRRQVTTVINELRRRRADRS